ncbi:ABC transporter permease [Clostridium gasigenes]|uniref:ABC transporter permease n=1 Tax=Clostridium gasigenes TaxID=94869 RepID=A0A1H0RJT8_9CLOT|nr:ABC transporter permease [Clostridium gasigenes]MBB6715248.1 ABC transporter permease [Clostridium gasigenes]SDP29701.1 ABC-2 type transport system permease protein [Clostridium gasigenes]
MGILIVVNNEFRRSLKYKKKLILGLLIPVISIIAAIAINSIMKPSINIGIINNGSGNIYEELKEESSFINGLNIKTAKEESINTDMILGKYAAIIQLNKDESFKVTSLDPEANENIKQIINGYFSNKELKGFEDALLKIENEKMTVAERSGGFILLTLIITCTLSACNLIKDKEDGILKRFLISLHKPIIYILGTYLYNILNTIVQIIIAIIILMSLPIDIGITGMQLLVIGFTIAIIATSLSSFIVALCKSDLQASIVASGTALIMSLLGGGFLPLDKMPTSLKYVSNVTITKWLVVFIKKIEQGVDNTDILVPMAIILCLSIIMVIGSCKLGKKKFV